METGTADLKKTLVEVPRTTSLPLKIRIFISGFGSGRKLPLHKLSHSPSILSRALAWNRLRKSKVLEDRLAALVRCTVQVMVNPKGPDTSLIADHRINREEIEAASGKRNPSDVTSLSEKEAAAVDLARRMCMSPVLMTDAFKTRIAGQLTPGEILAIAAETARENAIQRLVITIDS